MAYDKAYVAQDDVALAKALWRNLLNQEETLFDGNNEDLKLLTAYLKKQKMALKFCDEQKFLSGDLPFLSLRDALTKRR